MYEACSSITAERWLIDPPGGDVSFHSGNFVALGNSFTVDASCEFDVLISPPDGCPP